MSDAFPSRRAFLKHGTTAAAALAIATPLSAHSLGQRGLSGNDALPSHRGLTVPGIHAYADRESAFPGEVVRFQVSADDACRAAVYRLGTSVDDPDSDTLVEDFGHLPSRLQAIHPGSYGHVPKGLPKGLKALTIEAWLRPWRIDRLMGLVSQEDKESSEGWALGVGKDGYVGFYLGDGVSEDEALVHRTNAAQLKRGRWHHVVACWDGQEKQVWVDGQLAGRFPFAGPLLPGAHPIRLGAMGERGEATRFLDGDLAMVSVSKVAWDEATVARRMATRGLEAPKGASVLACWDFAEERGHVLGDRSRQGRKGRLVNHGTRMIGGPSFDASVPRFGEYDPRGDANRGHGLRLASDDLYDCHWQPTLEWRVPSDARSGLYVLRLRWEAGGQEFWNHAVVLVRRARRQRPAPILLLAATNTWRAYNAAAFGKPRPGPRQLCGTDGYPNSPGDPPAYSFYRGHAAGQGTYQMGRRIPWPASGPYLRYGDATDYSHLARADRFAQTWLEREGYDYEMVTDYDLHRDGARMRGHRVWVINGHSEYWSIEMYQALQAFLAGGGKIVVLSGNSLFWRVTFDDSGEVMECRKVDAPGDQLRPEQRGEAWHAHDGKRGGLLRECGYPGWALIGLETLGWNNQGDAKNFGPWIAEATEHPVFHEPEETGLKPGDRFGWAGPGAMPMANGHEFDIRLSTLASMAGGPIPPGAMMPVDPPGIRRLANGVIPWQHGGSAFDYYFRPIKPANEQGGEMIWWEREDGGTVFNAGTIGAGWALHADPRWGALLRNVLHRFGVERKAPRPS